MSHFNIRVYGIWIDNENNILVSDERIGDFMFTKFPGGGLEFGEGIHDCLKREWKEELDIDIEVIKHIYTTDFFQVSAFDNSSQIISIYYQVRPISTLPSTFNLKSEPFDFSTDHPMDISFRKISLSILKTDDVTLPIDKVVVDYINKLSLRSQGF